MAKMTPSLCDSITYFEDLSNDLLCEIFEYFNISEIDQIFPALNQRYANLVYHSNLPIKLNLSCISKSTYEKYYNHTVLSYQHRIHSIYLTNPFIFDQLSFSLFPRLQVLILENITVERLAKIFCESPHLSLLSIKLADVLKNASTLYEQILRLPMLQYCKISGEKRFSALPLQIFDQQFSVIKQLVISYQCNMNDLMILSFSLPQLHRLSCTNLIGLWSEYTHFQPIILNNLTHLSFKVENLSFDHLELFFTNLTHQLQVFNFSTDYQVDYFSARRWEDLISSKLPKLRLFNLQIKSKETTLTAVPYVSINQFTSSFWLKRQWYFRYEYQPTHAVFYSIHPYRSIHYELNSCSIEETFPCQTSKIFPSVNHLIHRGNISTRTNVVSFPCLTDLTIVDYSNPSMHSVSTIFDRFISLTKLYKLSIDHQSFCVTQLIDLLYFSPHIQILSVHSLSFSKVSPKSIKETETFQTISKQNQIRKITLKDISYSQIIDFFNQLCPRLQQMIVGCNQYRFFPRLDLQSFGAPFLCFLNFRGSIDRIRSHTTESHSIELIGTNLYVWS